METNNINGYEIQVFNQHNLDVGKKDQVCPSCSEERSSKNKKNKCASADWNRGILTCHHCGKTTQIHTFKKKGNKVYLKPTQHKDIDEKVKDWFLSKRAISEDTLRDAKITSSPGWIEFNFYAYGELTNRKSRTADKKWKLEKDCEILWYNFDALFAHDTIIITEGEIDALSYMECGLLNVVSVPNGATNFGFLDDSIDLFDNISKVYLSIDNDEAGEKLQAELIRRLGAEKCHTISLHGSKDANEFLVGHGSDALLSCYDSAEPLPLENVNTLSDISGELEEFFFEGAKPGYQIGLSGFDSVFSTYTSQFVVVTGVPGHGKSDFIDMMTMGYQKKYGWKTAYASPENKPDYIHASKIFRKYWDGHPNKEDVNSEKWNTIKEVVNDNFYFIDQDHFTLESVLKKGSELVKRKGIRCLVIDPFNKVRLAKGNGLSVPDYTMEYLTQVDVWSKKHDCLVILAAHPVKMQRKEDGEFEEPTFYSIKGGGEWYDMSYHGLCVYRNFSENTTKVKVLKVKFQNLGESGAECLFTWNKASGKFVELGDKDAPLPWEKAQDDVPF